MAKVSAIPSATFFSDPTQWRYHQLTANEPFVSIGTERELQTPQSLGLTAQDVRRPDAWQFAAPPNPLRDPRHAEFTRFRPGSLVLPDDAHVADALATVAEQYEHVKSRADTAGLWTSEQASWKKFTMQRGTAGFWFVQRQSGGDLESAIPPRIRDIVIQIATTYAVNASAADESRPDPADTNPGWPTFTAHPLGKLCSNVLVEPRFEGLLDNATTLARRLHLDEPSVLANGLGGRSGPLYKDTPLLRFNGSGWETYGTWKGYSQRNRVVQMSAAASNWMLKPLFNVLHGARSRIPGLWRTGNQDFELANRFKHRYESDISGFDVSVTRQLQVLVSWALASVMPHLKQDLSSWLFVETLGLITPHWGMQFGLATLERFKGGTRSGVKTTAEAGQFYSLTATLYALHLHGFDVSEWPHSGHFTVVVQGDDVIVSTDRPLDPVTWAKAYAAIGLKAELIEGDMFLSRHMSTERSSAPVAGRIVQQTLSNEHEPIGEMDETVGILALGFIARAEGAERLPQDLQRMAAKACSHASWFKRYGIDPSTKMLLSDMRSALLRSDEVRKDIDVALRARMGEDWLTEQAREAEHSPAAKLVVEWALRHGYAPGEKSLNLAGLVERLTKRILVEPLATRLELATTFSNVLMHDRANADIQFATTINKYGVT
jgi:hypothetical protein